MATNLPLVSVIIPSYNRFKYLLNTIDSIQKQTYKNIEIIVVNDASTQADYYSQGFHPDVKVIDLEKNSKEIFGYACAGYVRNEGIQMSQGDYIAFCDDDDIWFPEKLQIQMKALLSSKEKMCCTDGLVGKGIYNPLNSYKKYNAEACFPTIHLIHKYKGSIFMYDDRYPDIWTRDFLKVHNCIVCSSVLIEKDILIKIGGMRHLKNGQEDYDCWLRALEHTECVYLTDVCFYYDESHGDGKNYS